MHEVWTDGACLPNPGKGGWGWVSKCGRTSSGGEIHSTNQRMELMGVIDALRSFDGPIRITTDSMYVINGATKWHQRWLTNGWLNTSNRPVANRELWEQLLGLIKDRVTLFDWVKGHSGDEMNERADQLAHAATGLSPAVIAKFKEKYHGIHA